MKFYFMIASKMKTYVKTSHSTLILIVTRWQKWPSKSEPTISIDEWMPVAERDGAFSLARSPIRWITWADVTGLRIPMGSNPGTGLNNLFVMNINSRKLICIAVRDRRRHESKSKHEATKSEGRKGLESK